MNVQKFIIIGHINMPRTEIANQPKHSRQDAVIETITSHVVPDITILPMLYMAQIELEKQKAAEKLKKQTYAEKEKVARRKRLVRTGESAPVLTLAELRNRRLDNTFSEITFVKPGTTTRVFKPKIKKAIAARIYEIRDGNEHVVTDQDKIEVTVQALQKAVSHFDRLDEVLYMFFMNGGYLRLDDFYSIKYPGFAAALDKSDGLCMLLAKNILGFGPEYLGPLLAHELIHFLLFKYKYNFPEEFRDAISSANLKLSTKEFTYAELQEVFRNGLGTHTLGKEEIHNKPIGYKFKTHIPKFDKVMTLEIVTKNEDTGVSIAVFDPAEVPRKMNEFLVWSIEDKVTKSVDISILLERVEDTSAGVIEPYKEEERCAYMVQYFGNKMMPKELANFLRDQIEPIKLKQIKTIQLGM